MSIELEIARITSDKTKIRNKAVELGISTSSDNLDKLANDIAKIVNNGAVQSKVREGEAYTIPRGYHNGAGVVQGIAGGGSYELQAKTVTPNKSQQAVASDEGYYGLSSVTVEPIPANYNDTAGVTATAGDVLVNKVIVNPTGQQVAGTMVNNGTLTKTIDGLTATSVTIPAGYTAGGTVSLTADIENRLKEI